MNETEDRVTEDEVRQAAEMINNDIVPVSTNNIMLVIIFMKALTEELNARSKTFTKSRAAWDNMCVHIYDIGEEAKDIGFITKAIVAVKGYSALKHLIEAWKKYKR